MSTFAQGQHSEFHIYKGGDKVGNIQVSRLAQGDQVLYSMDSYSEFSVIWTQVVRTSARTEYLGELLSSCYSSIRVNDSVRDSSNMFFRDGKAHCYVHPEKLAQCSGAGEWSTARMYFEEPIDASSIFVESVLQECPLKPADAAGTYTLTFPNKTQNHYVYRNGILQEIQVIRPFFDLVFRRA